MNAANAQNTHRRSLIYKLFLILKYLRKRRIAWVSLIAVTLCTAMVIVVISVMGGWLRMFKESFHNITGDIIVKRSSQDGFAHYEQMMEQIIKLPQVAAAAPTLHTFGLINIDNGQLVDGVQVIGLPLEQFGDITGFRKSLHRQFEMPSDDVHDKNLSADERAAAEKLLAGPANFNKPYAADEYRSYLPEAKTDVSRWPGMIVGAALVNIGKDEHGIMRRPAGLYEAWARLTVLGQADHAVSVDVTSKAERAYWIVDDSHTGVWQYDQSSVYVPFDVLQRDLRMDEQTVTDEATKQQMIQPARTNDIRVKLKAGADLFKTRDQIGAIVEAVNAKFGVSFELEPVRVQTWQESNADYIGAIENEKVLVVVLFGIISIVAIFLIFCIFFMIVAEKTRDIGIIKSVGATSRGVAGIFLGYGLAIGIVGSGMGLLCGYLIVHNINFLHTEMGKLMGIQIWNPKVYAFDIIPNTMNPEEVTIIIFIAVLASVLGAVVPAVRAARLNPVEALRWE